MGLSQAVRKHEIKLTPLVVSTAIDTSLVFTQLIICLEFRFFVHMF